MEVPVLAEAVVQDEDKQGVVSVAYLMVNQIKDPDAELDNFALTAASDLCCRPAGVFPRDPSRVRPRFGVRPGHGLQLVAPRDIPRWV